MTRDPKFVDAGRFDLPDDGAWQRSYMGLPTIVSEVKGVPVKAFGRLFVYGQSPDFQTGVVLQQGNSNPQVKITPKPSWEITDNYVGSMVSYQPRIPQNDFQAFLAVNLIDGNPNSAWCSRGDGQPDVTPAWVRVDLAAEEKLTEIVLVPRKDRLPWPKDLKVKLSCDAWHWTTVYDSTIGQAPVDGEPVHIRLPSPTPAKQIWVEATQLPFDAAAADGDYTFSFAQLQALDAQGEDVALISRGSGVTVSSTCYGFGGDWIYNDIMWPLHYELGAKWIRLSGGNAPWHQDTLQWRFVEQEKGKYIVDPRTKAALAEAAAHGCKIIVMLTYGNFLYTQHPEKQILDYRHFPAEFPPAPTTHEEFEAYKAWVRAMAEAFRGSVAYWEIWNEPEGFGWEVIKDYHQRVKVYCDLMKEAVQAIREVDPDVKVSIAGMAGVPGPEFNGPTSVPNTLVRQEDWLRHCLEQGIAPLVDAIQWHIQGSVLPDLPGWKVYPKVVRDFQRDAEAAGFKGVYMASEYWLAAPYPPHAMWAHPPHHPLPGMGHITEIRKAKDTARVYVANAGLNVIPFWCNTWWEGPRDCGIFRITWAADPISPEQPEPAFYAIRTLGTAMEGVRPAELKVELSNKSREFDIYSFTQGNSWLVGLWLPDPSVDRHPGVTTDVVIHGDPCQRVVGIDTLNGFEQELHFEMPDGKVVVPGVVVQDYPLLLRLER